MADENEHSNSKFPSKMLCDGRQFKKKKHNWSRLANPDTELALIHWQSSS